MSVREYDAYKPTAFEKVRESFDRLRQAYEFIVIEGAGSISEINLKQSDIANLKIAGMARCPVILVADIDRGGVFAQIVGTIELLEPQERAYINGIIINKFRGDAGHSDPRDRLYRAADRGAGAGCTAVAFRYQPAGGRQHGSGAAFQGDQYHDRA